MIAEIPRPFLFIHIPKTAGTSVETALTQVVCGKPGFEDLSREEATRHALPGGARQMRGTPYRATNHAVQHEAVEYFEDLGQLDGRHVFSVVRNPYDRALSQLIYLLRTDERAKQVFRGPTWADDLKVYAEYRGVMGHDLTACQVDWLTDRSGRMRSDRLLRFENLNEDWKKLCADLGMEDKELPHLNSTRRNVPWWEFYDEKAAAGIARKYARDFELLGYETELPTHAGTKAVGRVAWLGGGEPPEHAFLLPRRTRHGRLELPDSSVGALHLYGHLEMIRPADARILLKECHRVLLPNGKLMMNTLDLEFLAGLLPGGYEEGSLQQAFVRSYVDRHLPEVDEYAPAYVINDIMRRKGQVFLYDEALLAEFLAEAGFDGERQADGPPGEIVVVAERSRQKS